MALQAAASLRLSPWNLRHRHRQPAPAGATSQARLSSSSSGGGGGGRVALDRSSLKRSAAFLPDFRDLSSGLGRGLGGRNVGARASASGEVPVPAKEVASSWEGVKPVPFVLSVGVGVALRFLVRKPESVTMQAWQLLAIFASTITGLVLSPLPVGAWAFLGLTVAVVTKTLTFAAAFGAFTNDVIWLIVISYGLALSETLLAPAMPSTTARAGGVFLPIIGSLSLSSGSKPKDKSASKLGAYLVMTQFQVILIPDAFFFSLTTCKISSPRKGYDSLSQFNGK
jgi:hypothetical protein